MLFDNILDQESRNASNLDFGSQLGPFSFKFDNQPNLYKNSLKIHNFNEQDTRKAIEKLNENPIYKPEDELFKFNFDDFYKPNEKKVDNELSSCSFGDESKGDMFRFPPLKNDKIENKNELETCSNTKDFNINDKKYIYFKIFLNILNLKVI